MCLSLGAFITYQRAQWYIDKSLIISILVTSSGFKQCSLFVLMRCLFLCLPAQCLHDAVFGLEQEHR